MGLNPDILASDMVRGYLRRIQGTNSLGLTGVFQSEGEYYIWGACAEYGDPCLGAVVVELGHPNGHTADFRIWHANQKDDGNVYKGKAVMYSELEEPCSLTLQPKLAQKN